MRSIWLTLILCLVPTSVGRGQQWAKDMFENTSHDFGTVARGAEMEHRFKLENIYVEDVHIAKVVSTCKCHNAKIVTPTLKTYEQGEIVIQLDTKKFIGRKDATVRVVFDKPFAAEVQLNTYCYIRSDVVFEPGLAQFGSVQHGTPSQKLITVSYAGRSDWKIVDVESTQPYLEVSARELSRNASDITYELTVGLKESAPAGYVKDHVMLVTNDNNPKARRVPLPVEAIVVSAITASPSPLSLVVRAGETDTRNLVIQANAPFRIVKITGPDDRFRFSFSDTPKPLQLVPVTFTAGPTPGDLAGTIVIHTDLANNKTLEVKVNGRVLAADSDTSLKNQSAPTSQDKKAPGWQPRAR